MQLLRTQSPWCVFGSRHQCHFACPRRRRPVAAEAVGGRYGFAGGPDEARGPKTQLVDRARRGDAQAFRALVERYQRWCSLALGFKDPDEARGCRRGVSRVYRQPGTFQRLASF